MAGPICRGSGSGTARRCLSLVGSCRPPLLRVGLRVGLTLLTAVKQNSGSVRPVRGRVGCAHAPLLSRLSGTVGLTAKCKPHLCLLSKRDLLCRIVSGPPRKTFLSCYRLSDTFRSVYMSRCLPKTLLSYIVKKRQPKLKWCRDMTYNVHAQMLARHQSVSREHTKVITTGQHDHFR